MTTIIIIIIIYHRVFVIVIIIIIIIIPIFAIFASSLSCVSSSFVSCSSSSRSSSSSHIMCLIFFTLCRFPCSMSVRTWRRSTCTVRFSHILQPSPPVGVGGHLLVNLASVFCHMMSVTMVHGGLHMGNASHFKGFLPR